MSVDTPDLRSTELPSTAQVIIIGGGIIGCNVAYHLAKRGWTDVVLLEKHRLTSGTTWHAAGLVVTSGFTTETAIEIAKYTLDLYANLEAETGYATGFKAVGLLQIAATECLRGDLVLRQERREAIQQIVARRL